MNIFGSDNEKDTYAPAPIPERLRKGERIAIITADKTEDLEFFYPFYRFNEEGYTVDVITPNGGKFEGKHGIGLKRSKAIDECNAVEYALLYVPGGKAPEELRKNKKIIDFVQAFCASGKPVAAICHGAQVLLDADVIKGRKIAAWPGIKDELTEKGVNFADEALAIDGQFITARMPGDLHRHMCGVFDYLNGTAEMKARSSQNKPNKFAAV